jgi:hypothetical protein
MIFVEGRRINRDHMTKSSSSSTKILIVLLLLITFPFWIGALGIAVGILAGAFGAFFGIIGSVLGALISLIFLPFKIVFGTHDYSLWPHFNLNGFVVVMIIILVILISKHKK